MYLQKIILALTATFSMLVHSNPVDSEIVPLPTQCQSDETWTEDKCAKLEAEQFGLMMDGGGKTVWIATATWRIGEYGNLIYLTHEGKSGTKDGAWIDAKNTCSRIERAPRSLACNTTARVRFEKHDVVDELWGKWSDVGRSPGNPCPSGTHRGSEVGIATRIVNFIQIQYKHKFQCVKILETVVEDKG